MFCLSYFHRERCSSIPIWNSQHSDGDSPQPVLSAGCPGNNISNLILISGVLKPNSWLSTEKIKQGVETQMGIPQNQSGYLGGIPKNNQANAGN